MLVQGCDTGGGESVETAADIEQRWHGSEGACDSGCLTLTDHRVVEWAGFARIQEPCRSGREMVRSKPLQQ